MVMIIFILPLVSKTRPPVTCSARPERHPGSQSLLHGALWFLTVTLSYSTCELQGPEAETALGTLPLLALCCLSPRVTTPLL